MKLHTAGWVLIAGIVFTSAAAARPDTRSMTCEQLKVLIEDESVVVMDTGPQTYKRFVYHQGFCSVAEIITSARVDASDGECRLKVCRIRRSNDAD